MLFPNAHVSDVGQIGQVDKVGLDGNVLIRQGAHSGSHLTYAATEGA